MPGIEAMPLPGHTPGHTGYLLRGKDNDLLIWGDALHLATVQAADPNLGLIYDLAPQTAATTRKAVLEQAALGGWVVAGGHVGFGKVHREDESYRISPL